MSEVSVQDAIDAYITAAMYAFDGWPKRPSNASVEAIETTVFRINSPESPDNRGQRSPALATCSYNKEAQEWIVQFTDEQIVKLRDVDGELSVATE